MAQEKSAQEYLVKAKLYRFMCLLLVTIGIFIFCVLYVKNIDGQFLTAIKQPKTIFIFLMPFLPAAVMSMMADSAEKKYKATLKKDSPQK